MDESTTSIAAYSEDVRPYKIHVSSKYLALTKRKLELTRLPHEILLPRSREWENGTPKSDIEPLIDFWLEEYSWRRREEYFNAWPQYRTAITLPGQVPLRVHFIHVKSSQLNAIPLLLIPSFPFTNLCLVPLLKVLTEPEEGQQAFHVVCPSLPGIGFSDAHVFTSSHGIGEDEQGQNTVLESTARLLDILMQKLGYERYLASSTGSGTGSPAHIDYEIPSLLASNHSDNCVGIHLLDPPSSQPVLISEPWNWTKFAIAKFFHASIFGYAREDWQALNGAFSTPPKTPHPSADEDLEAQAEPHLATATSVSSRTHAKPGSRASRLGLGLSPSLLLTQPNTLSYALCDSPVGLLSLVLAGLRHLSPSHDLSPTDIIDVTQMAWLPGPEAALRFWSGAAQGKATSLRRKSEKSRTATAVTTFLGVEGGEMAYRPPEWAGGRHNVVVACRREGKAGIVACERGSAVVDGIRALAGEVLKNFPVLIDQEDEMAAEIQIEMVGAVVEEEMGDERDETDVQLIEAESPDTIILAREL